MPGGCSTSHTIIFITTEDFRTGNKRLDESKQHSGRAFIGKRSGAHGLEAPTEEI